MKKLEQFFIDRGSAKSTKQHYTASVKLYEELNGQSLDSLIEEADNEEEKGIRWKKRKLKERLLDFRNYLYQHKSEGTARQYFADVLTVYRHFEIELQQLPSFNSKQIDKTYQMDYTDLITSEQLIDAYYEANNEMKNIIEFGISTGMSKVDMLKLTVQDFAIACDVHTGNVLEAIHEIKKLNKNNLIPCFIGTRQKTGVKYITFCSPEAVEHIVQRLIGRDASIKETYQMWQLKLDDSDPNVREKARSKLETLPQKLEWEHKLFDISDSHLLYSFKKINNKLGLGKVGKYSKMRCHMLRKYHASTLLNCKEVQWTKEEIDTLQGRVQDMTHRAYFHNSRDKLYEKYCACVDELMLFESIHEVDKHEYDRIKQENVKLDKKLEEQQKTIEQIISNQRELEALLGL